MPTGVSSRPEKYGGSKVDDRRDELRRTLESFEARVNVNNPEEVAALEEIRRETRELERLRGVWQQRGLPGVQRDWNDLSEPEHTKAPLEDPSYRAYKQQKELEVEFTRPPRALPAPPPPPPPGPGP